MAGRGIDQILEHPSEPRLFEPYVRDAREYVALAEAAHGALPRRVADSYMWGDALQEVTARRPAARIVNLETSITRASSPWPAKGIHYRMHPANIGCLTAAGLDVCTLANNHVMDFGHDGLLDTLDALAAAGIATAGAGRTLAEAQAPAVVPIDTGRLLVFAAGSPSSGVPEEWAAGPERPGLDVIDDYSADAASDLGARVRKWKQPGDLAVVSIHWGDNWGYDVPDAHRQFARALIDAGVDLVHGHSSHHPRPIEVYHGRIVLYGCGDLLNDYEGIPGYEDYRDDLALLYFPVVSAAAEPRDTMEMVPVQIRRFRLQQPSPADVDWLRRSLDSVNAAFGTRIVRRDGALAIAGRDDAERARS
jgi:poly-gamma-glutamate synthesis protein (capsule biosynthesis protein)